MKKKKRIIIIITTILVIALLALVYYIFTKEDKESTLNLLEKQWIQSNKNEMIDFGLVNNIAILNNSTDSLVFDFLEDLEKTTGLDFNEVSYDYGEKIDEAYAFKNVEKVSKNDILIYSDNYVLIGKKENKYNDINKIVGGMVGVVNDDLDKVSKYLNNSSITYKTVGSKYLDMLLSFKEEDSELNYIVMPKLLFLSYYENYDNLYINYNISELQDNYVISLGKKNRLNDILKKYYEKWSSENYEETFSKEFTNMYYKVSKTTEQAKVKFRSKRYTYGFVENAPFDIEVNGKLYGINSSILKNFSKVTNAEITFKRYDNIVKLKEAFKKNEIDFTFDKYSKSKLDMDVYNTVSISDEKVVIVSPYSNNIIINSLNSLEQLKVAVLDNTKIYDELKDICKDIKKYNSVLDLVKSKGIIALDMETYNFYKNDILKNYKVDYEFNLRNEYTYIMRDVKNNAVFNDFLNYYVTYINEKSYINEGYSDALKATTKSNTFRNIMYLVGGLLCLLVAFILGSKIMPKNKKDKTRKIAMKKEDKLKYIDMLTSLKNRNYLNDNIENWDESEVYPQSIVIIDLNNIAYINDNYGHQEGDNIIKEAANKLINMQITNSDIIRTNGNEFLIYLVGYDEKQIVAYIKKMKKELKELAHGFGAAVGYSMITDGIKTIDDAVNEATLDMRNDKEDLNN
ncbi:MAG TPA: GGDEF domain-containing protein [Bacilli bacterium]|nr:GGDEF domain-containing protein [Bacilli bacterium]